MRDANGKEIERLTAERDELRKAPGMGEVDAMEDEYLFTLKTLRHLGSLADRFSLRDIAVKLATLARQAIDSREMEKKRADEWQKKCENENSVRLIVEKERDEIVNLLMEAKRLGMLGEMEFVKLFTHPSLVVSLSRKILEIVEGK